MDVWPCDTNSPATGGHLLYFAHQTAGEAGGKMARIKTCVEKNRERAQVQVSAPSSFPKPGYVLTPGFLAHVQIFTTDVLALHVIVTSWNNNKAWEGSWRAKQAYPGGWAWWAWGRRWGRRWLGGAGRWGGQEKTKIWRVSDEPPSPRVWLSSISTMGCSRPFPITQSGLHAHSLTCGRGFFLLCSLYRSAFPIKTITF